jgi:prepilin-type N-terminal cleavage/methylation domain-containing protein
VQSTELMLVQNAAKAGSRVAQRKGFTLVEVMVATALLTMVGLGILSVLVGAYRVAAKARYRDQARYVVKSLADQFLTQQPADASGNTYPFFQVTQDGLGNSVPLGTALKWTNSDGTGGSLASDSTYYSIYIGGSTNSPILAKVTRTVTYVAPDGTSTLIFSPMSAGDLLEGDFTITYPYLGQTQTQTISAMRAFP